MPNSTKVIKQVDYWKGRLLDLGKRNSLINFKPNRTSVVTIIDPVFEEIFSFLEIGTIEFAQLFEIEEETEEDFIFEKVTSEGEETITLFGITLPKKDSYSEDELRPVIAAYKAKRKTKSKKQFFTNASYNRQQATLRNLLKKYKLFKEENAINILHLAVGMVQWFETIDSTESFLSPLVLIPVEMKQQGFDGPFSLSFIDYEMILNESLIKKMKSDYGYDFSFVFDETQSDQDNLHHYFETLKKQWKDPRWNIIESIHLGVFSFSKINMVKDLEDHLDAVTNDALVQAISGDVSALPPQLPPHNLSEIDSLIKPAQFFQVVDADSSQELAIQEAIAGRSFVLQGPPGTGKSQTITNIIAELIARGKKVLFVAEKKAALDVVYANLKKSGIHPYALPLHNDKIDKKSIITELNDTLMQRQEISSIDSTYLNQMFEKFQINKDKLDSYAYALLQPHPPLNYHLYRLFGEYVSLESFPEIKFQLPNLLSINMELFTHLNQTIGVYFHVLKGMNFDPSNHVFYGLIPSYMALSQKEEFEQTIHLLHTQLVVLKEKVQDTNQPFYLKSSFSLDDVLIYSKLYDHLAQFPHIDSILFNLKAVSNKLKTIETLYKYRQTMKQIVDELLQSYDEEVLEIEIEPIFRLFRQHQEFYQRWFSTEYKKSRAQLLSYQSKSRKSYRELSHDIYLLKSYQKAKKSLLELIPFVGIEGFNAIDIDQYPSTISKLKWLQTFDELTSHSSIESQTKDVRGILSQLYNTSPSYLNLTQDILNTHSIILRLISRFQPFFDIKTLDFNHYSISDLTNLVQSMMSNFAHLELYLSYNQSVEQAKSDGITEFIEQVLSKKIYSDWPQVFARRFYALLIDHLTQKTPEILTFKRDVYDKIQKDYQLSDKAMMAIVKLRLNTYMATQTPSIAGLEGLHPEILTLRREAEKSRKHLPIRVLFERIPNLILILKPCLMMSPLSVSSYLKSTDYKFDTVIFDEASQVRPESAIGALYRSKQAIIVGDKEQLPPTNFFQSVEEDTESPDDFDAYQSILEVAGAILTPISLHWHYRSKFEELIHISNQEIYKNLVTFPSTKIPSSNEGIDFIYVPGVFERRNQSSNASISGGSNRIEAEKVVASIIDHFERFGTTRSLGVVTFNIAQQALIEHLLRKQRKQNPGYEPYFSEDLPEPLFIKNIETVQGDERDTIIISIAYGYDSHGKMSMNFGPLNQEGGYRRLNVAITRAKHNVIVVSSIKSSDIDLSRTQSRGVSLLKQYLAYAEVGDGQRENNGVSNLSVETGIVNDIYHTLLKLGYCVHTQVGSSTYHLDLAICHPTNPNTYLMGIECDGSAYLSSPVTRDRERLRPEVLELRGWKIYRIWSTDWIHHKESEIKRLQETLLHALEPLNEESTPLNIPLNLPINTMPKSPKQVPFVIYPNYSKLLQQCRGLPTILAIEKIIQQTSPLHIDELKKIVPPLYQRIKFSSFVETELTRDIQNLSKQGRIIIEENFLSIPNIKIVFRSHVEGSSTRREIDHIASKEIIHGLIQIVSISKVITKEDLMNQLLDFCGYKSSSSNINANLDQVIQQLIVKKLFMKDSQGQIRLG